MAEVMTAQDEALDSICTRCGDFVIPRTVADLINVVRNIDGDIYFAIYSELAKKDSHFLRQREIVDKYLGKQSEQSHTMDLDPNIRYASTLLIEAIVAKRNEREEARERENKLRVPTFQELKSIDRVAQKLRGVLGRAAAILS